MVNRKGNCAGNGRRPRLKRRCDEFGTRGSSSPAVCRLNLFGKIVSAMYACSTHSLITSPEQQLKKGPWFQLWYFKDRYRFPQIAAGDLELETFAICPKRDQMGWPLIPPHLCHPGLVQRMDARAVCAVATNERSQPPSGSTRRDFGRHLRAGLSCSPT